MITYSVRVRGRSNATLPWTWKLLAWLGVVELKPVRQRKIRTKPEELRERITAVRATKGQ